MKKFLERIGFKGSLPLLYWALMFVGLVAMVSLRSFAVCTGNIMRICFPYGFILMAAITYPAVAILQIFPGNVVGDMASMPAADILLATVLYFLIGLLIDFLLNKKKRP